MSGRRGPPKHQNQVAWKPKAGIKINETEVGGRFRPLPAVYGVCQRCKDQIDWKRRYGKYKPLIEPAKCQHCSKRAVRHAYHNLCSGCAKEQKVCAKCQCRVDQIVGRDSEEAEAEQKMLEDAIKNSRERDRRTLMRTMGKAKTKTAAIPPTTERNKAGDLFPSNTSLEGYAAKASGVRPSDTNNKDLDEGEEDHDGDEQEGTREEEEEEEEEDDDVEEEGDDSEEENDESESGNRVEQAHQRD